MKPPAFAIRRRLAGRALQAFRRGGAGAALAAAAFLGLGFAVFAERAWGLAPCPLCMAQRSALGAAGAMFGACALAQWLRGPAPARIAAAAAGLFALAGAAAAGWQLRLQYGPGASPGVCMEPEGLLGWIARTFGGSGDCAEIGWAVLGVSAAFWTLAAFLGLAAAAAAVLAFGFRKEAA